MTTTAENPAPSVEARDTAGPAKASRGRAVAILVWSIRHWSVVVAGAVLVVAVLWALVPGWFAHSSPTAIGATDKLLPPSSAHWFGTDRLGRDQYSRVVHGARASLSGSVVAVLIGVAVGSVFGALAGWFGRWIDAVVMRLIDVVLSIPGFLLAITIVVVLGYGILQAAAAVGLTSSAAFARLIRSEVLRARTSQYVEAAVASGARSSTILLRHVVPNSLGPTLSLVTIQFGISIIWIASLSFLGLGAQPPSPEWGRLVADGRNFLASKPYLVVYPALTVAAVVLAGNRLARHFAERQKR
ncbi:ABC transporter permease [Streptomyces samsunensis]|uniref:ABC transporter permease n=1 Tax=Streptomyces malaysiensis TaxID=92644 RepID=A0ABX6VZI5_STRMQ|nr:MULTISPECIES: ABC transporter permease [Streptomyces]MCC4313915.1 ABC transporter permease [Streptomyces malaysiensis]MCM3804393.1 ABC transporter permease [Streptomyces sp. DR7-3]NUH35912.1 ABC transporter permease [Streptomyces samsunensis]QPI54053.1 ABC transporter permease [Streptomyces solisilvae]UHH15433.1 ABC transporter permease [Streptomyces sp. HNM0561]